MDEKIVYPVHTWMGHGALVADNCATWPQVHSRFDKYWPPELYRLDISIDLNVPLAERPYRLMAISVPPANRRRDER
jgi:hypothetical protein